MFRVEAEVRGGSQFSELAQGQMALVVATVPKRESPLPALLLLFETLVTQFHHVQYIY
jgi:hypothetical protein